METNKINQLAKLSKAFLNCLTIDELLIPDDNRDPFSDHHPAIITMKNVFDCMNFDLTINEALQGEEYEYVYDLIKNDLVLFMQRVFISVIESPNFTKLVENKLKDLK
jgi:hypothetical protein